MDYDVLEAEYVSGYVIKLRFRDGTAGEIDLGPELWGEVFEPLKDREKFRRCKVDPEAGTIVWENGADLAPESLYSRAKAIK